MKITCQDIMKLSMTLRNVAELGGKYPLSIEKLQLRFSPEGYLCIDGERDIDLVALGEIDILPVFNGGEPGGKAMVCETLSGKRFIWSDPDREWFAVGHDPNHMWPGHWS